MSRKTIYRLSTKEDISKVISTNFLILIIFSLICIGLSIFIEPMFMVFISIGTIVMSAMTLIEIFIILIKNQ